MSVLVRLPVLEWCHRTAAGELPALDWVDTTVEVHPETFRAVEADDGAVRFQHVPYAGFQPPSMLEAQQAAQARGVPTLQEALLLLFARPEWHLAARDRAWTSLTAVPPVLRRLVEAYGIERALHRDNPEALARLVALLAVWFPARGTHAAATRVIEAAAAPPPGELRTLDVDGPQPPALEREVFVCRATTFWEARCPDGAATAMRIEGGVLLYQTPSVDVPLRREDVALAWRPETTGTTTFWRLLPPWTLVRPYLTAETA